MKKDRRKPRISEAKREAGKTLASFRKNKNMRRTTETARSNALKRWENRPSKETPASLAGQTTELETAQTNTQKNPETILAV